ncbi:hypothetical protein SD80_013995 [Scytonema tolypothrichoides VB-61278]|nr:hypothetical protein SD80_013995 [Scytonema tolypothrichoides VB-61278]
MNLAYAKPKNVAIVGNTLPQTSTSWTVVGKSATVPFRKRFMGQLNLPDSAKIYGDKLVSGLRLEMQATRGSASTQIPEAEPLSSAFPG